LSTHRLRKLSSTSAEIAVLSFARRAFREKRQPDETARVARLRNSKSALVMLKTGLKVAPQSRDREGNFLVSRSR
jgi:hypothetical protein